MYPTTPPNDENLPENRPQRRPRASIPSREQRPYTYRPDDEHPEIPKIRRASRYLDPSTLSTFVERDEQETAVDDPQQTDSRQARLRDTSQTHLPRQRRPYTYAPPPNTPPPAQRIQRTRPKRSPQQELIHIARSQPYIPISFALVLLLLFSIVIINVSRSQSNAVSSSLGTPTSPFTVTPQTGIQSGNPYELIIAPEDTDHPPPPVNATSAYLLDADTGAILYAHNPFMHLPMMSTTKLMTAILAVQQGKLDQPITITAAMANDISQLSADSTLFGLKKGETYTLRDLLYGLLLKSGNDAAIAIADALGGNQQRFVAEMNQKALQLGLNDTHYMNPHGLLQAGHYSSAHDLAMLGRYSFNIPIIRQISGTEAYDIPKTSQHPDHPLLNGNQFLFWYPGVDAGKPGYDGASNFVQVISVTRNHHHLIGVTMHTNNWWTDMRDLMNWGLDNFTWISPHDVDSVQNPIPYDYLWNYFASDKKDSTITTTDGRYYIYTGYTISDPILSYFDHSGGLTQFGYPIGLQIAASSTAISQRFEKSTIQCNLATNQCSTV